MVPKFLSIKLAVAFGLLGLQWCPGDSFAQERHHTQVRLVADVKSVQPETTFHVGLLMMMDPGWHTYWKNPGEAGLPPEIEWTLPEGITAGEILWPVPHKYVEGGEVVVYGYEKENMLIVPMTASASLSEGTTVTIKAFASWLECKELCVPADDSTELALAIDGRKPTPDNLALFDRYVQRVPQSYSKSDAVSLSIRQSNEAVELHIAPGAGKKLAVARDSVPDFYPEAYDGLGIGRTEVSATADGATLRIPLSLFTRGSAPDTIRGVLLYQLLSGERKARMIDIPLSSDFIGTLRVVGEKSSSLLDQPFITDGVTDAKPLLTYVFFAIVGGLLLNIMPCVLPVIGLKVFGLMKLGGEDPAKVKKLGAFFSLGIVATFLVMALLVILLKAAGEQIGWGFQFQEPVFVIIMCTIVFAFGLSLFGVFEIRLPGTAVAGLSDAVNKAGSEGGSSAGSFSEGVFATILATPCTAPILGTALGFAFAQPADVVLLIFTCVAIGMSLPYFVLTLKPGWMKWLPKPGEWMVTAKQFMGFLMMATLVWLLYVLGKQLGMEGVIWTGAFLVVVGFACWLIGRFATLTASRGKNLRTWVLALLVLAAGYWLFLQPVIEADEMISGAAGASNEESGIAWEPFSLPVLEGYLKDGKPVFIDFTADWCLTCKVNEKAVLTDEDVVEKFNSSGIIAIKADWTRRDPAITRLLSKFGRSGVPLYVIFPAGKPREPIVLPEVITSGMVVEAIEKATHPNTAL